MERIKQAIEKVNQQRKKNTAESFFSTIDKGMASPQRDTSSVSELGNISYEHTRVVRLLPEHLEKNRIISNSKSDVKSVHFDLLRTHVLQIMKEKGWRTLAITSPTPESGKSVISINLAMSISQLEGTSSLLVDFDLRRPKIGTYLGLPMEKSLNDLLDGKADLSEVLINPDLPRMVVLATKSPVRRSSEVLASRRVADLIVELRERYTSRIVIFDLPPVLVSDDVIALLPQVDCVLLVIGSGMSTKREIENSIRLLPADKLIGTVLNKAETEHMDYYYY